MVMLLMVNTAEELVFFSVVVLTALLVAILTLPKLSDDGVKLSVGFARPVPLTLTTWVLVTSLSDRVMVPVSAFAEAGLKLT